MICDGYLVSEEQQVLACLLRMTDSFTKETIRQAAIQAGVPEAVGLDRPAYKLATRLLKKMKKSGKVTCSGKGSTSVWTRVRL